MREMLDRRPMLVFGIGLVLGLTILIHPFNVFFVLVFAISIIRHQSRMVLVGATLVGLVLTPTPIHSVENRSYVDIEGRVVSLPKPIENGMVATVSTTSQIWRMTMGENPHISMGDTLHVRGVGLPLQEGSESYLETHGVGGRLHAETVDLVSHGPPVYRMASAWRVSFRDFCRHWMPLSISSLTEALCFDLNAGLSGADLDNLKKIGTLHLVSASGLHVFYLAGALMWVLALLPIPRTLQILCVLTVILIYVAATGFSPAVVRTGSITVLALGAYLFQRIPDTLSGLALASSGYLLWQPRLVYDPGFQLSAITVGAIALFVHRAEREGSIVLRSVKIVANLSWVAFVASGPILAFHFGAITPISLPANFLLGLPAALAMLSALVAHAVGSVLPAVGVGILTIVTAPMVGWVLWFSEHSARWPYASIDVPAFSAYWLPIFYGMMLLTWRKRILQP